MTTTTNNRRTVYLRGKASYAKILGAPVLNYSKDGKEWAMDLELDAAGEKQAKSEGMNIRKKDEYLNGKPYVSFRQRELRPDGSKNEPPVVKDADGNVWPEESKIGNGSTVDVKCDLVDYGAGKKQGVYLKGVRILKHEPYERTDFPPLSADDEFFSSAAKAPVYTSTPEEDAQFAKDFGREELDDDVPV